MQELTPYSFAEFEAALEGFDLKQINAFAVAVSGGADSLALTFLLAEWAIKHKKKVVAFHVDHRLRAASQDEAKQLQAWLQSKKIASKILLWDHEGIDARIQEKARHARYQLLEKACQDEGIAHLFLGHHRGDQEETFWMRLLKGSGPEGLAGMRSLRECGAITLLRPLLDVESQRLKLYLATIAHPYIQDPSNENENYLRIRIRNSLRNEGHSFEMLSKTMDRLREDADYFESLVGRWIIENVEEHIDSQLIFPREKLISCPPALGKRILIRLLQIVGRRSYPPRREGLDALWRSLQTPSFKGATLSHCWVRKRGQMIIITKEARHL